MGDVMNFEIEQIKPETKYLIAKYNSRSFVSSHQQKYFHKQLSAIAKQSGLSIAAIDKSVTLEQLSDEDLAKLGLKRINNDA
ncbi:hypothetical protein PCA27_12365 [Acinetobacter baumannii]|uniref:hypothetical protein n=1 Tax=Acinetobacter baumannii TaxID=470 RepID=UPI00234D5AB0|nr:hypothetical protein [Acinetobacter baumannii]MCE6791344.1 hypothetical protein [Acinetobacter baumannii]MDC7638664.1 hypothetical protein [Acinetobacter baumannii]MDC7661520.1 hypothetical protein [Acinetobacter baumannii]